MKKVALIVSLALLYQLFLSSVQAKVLYIDGSGDSGGGGYNSALVRVASYNNPAPSVVRHGSTGITMGHIQFDSIREAADLNQLKIFVNDGGVPGTAVGNYQDVTMVYVYDHSTLLASAAMPSTGFYTFNFPRGTFTIPKDGGKILTLKADIATISSVADNAPGTPAADIVLGLGGTDGFKFTGTTSNQEATEVYDGATTTPRIIHKSVPFVAYSNFEDTLGAVTSLTNGPQDLYKFRVSTDSSGNEVLLYRTSFVLATGGAGTVSVQNCYLKDQNGYIVSAQTSMTPTDIDYSATNLTTFLFNNPNISAGNNKEALQIPAGSSMTYTLNCTVGSAGPGNYLYVSLLGDTASSSSPASQGTHTNIGQNLADAWSAYHQGNFVWSDNYKNRSLDADGANATAWGQWYNGHLVSGLGLYTTTTAYTIGWAN